MKKRGDFGCSGCLLGVEKELELAVPLFLFPKKKAFKAGFGVF